MREMHFCLHGVGPPPSRVSEYERPYWLTSGRFAEIVRLGRKYETPARRIVFSFDDGNKSDVTTTLPILRQFGFRASFFISSDMIGMTDFVDATDIVRLRDAGMTVGSHGAAHVRWITLDDRALADQIDRSIRILSGILGNSPSSVAPPFGAYNRRILRVLRQLGVTEVHTTDDGPARSGAWIKPRFTISMDTPLQAVETRLAGRLGGQARLRALARRYARRLS
jgi:peptidoglycan/xylan/chitin deacetylase (PgdA/CDA1 family)